MKSPSKLRTGLLILLSLVCVLVWLRNIRLMKGGAHSTAQEVQPQQMEKTEIRLPVEQDFKASSRDPFQATATKQPQQPQYRPPPKPNVSRPVKLPYVFVGVVGSRQSPRAMALLRDDLSGDVRFVGIQDTVLGYSLSAIGQDTLHFESKSGTAYVLSK